MRGDSGILENDMREFDLKELLEEQGPNLYLYHKGTNDVTIISGVNWYTRLWYLISNPFVYLFTGKIRY